MSQELLNRLLSSDTLVLIVGGSIAIVAIIANAIRAVVRSTTQERTRREIAAYIAEGSMTPEQGERLLVAGESHKKPCG
ncbi:MAG: hypothetical protein JNM80_10140 [Phycisphaerae bacterium]|nr:hypothetical protein [Phycisphaerae bacterium]